MNDMKKLSVTVEGLVQELRDNETTRFSKADYQTLIFAILADKDFKAKKYLIRNDEIFEETSSISDGLSKFLDKLLRHAGVTSSDERASIIDSFDYTPRDVEWVSDCVDEAMWQYTECGKNMRMFRDKMLQLSIRKMKRSGKFDGRVTYKKSVMDKAEAIMKKKKRG